MIKCGEKHKLVKSSELFNSEMSYSTFSYVVTSSKAEQRDFAMVNVTSDRDYQGGYSDWATTRRDYFSSLTSMLTAIISDVQEVQHYNDEIPEDAKPRSYFCSLAGIMTRAL